MSIEYSAQVAYTPTGLAQVPEPLQVTQGEQLYLAFAVRSQDTGQLVRFTDYQGFGVFLPSGPSGAIKRTTYGFEVQAEQVHVGDSSVVVRCPGHGLVTGDWLYFDQRAPQPWQLAAGGRQAIANVIDQDNFFPAGVDGSPIMPGPLDGAFTIAAKYDLQVPDDAPTTLLLHLRSPVSLALSAGTGQNLEVRLQGTDELRIIPLPAALDVHAPLG